MTREESWQLQDGTTLAILHAITAAGFRVSVFRLSESLFGTTPAMIEMHAIRDGEPMEQHFAKVGQAEPDAEYRCASFLRNSIQPGVRND